MVTFATRLISALAFLVVFSAGHVQAADLNQSSWSEIDGSNTAPPPNGWPAGMQPNQVEPAARAMMGGIKRFYDHANVTVTSTGTANTQTLTYAQAPQALVAGDIYRFFVGTGLTNTGPATLNVNGLGAMALVSGTGAALTGGELVAGTIVETAFDGTNFRITSTGNTIHGSALISNGSLTISGGAIFLDNNQSVAERNTGGVYGHLMDLDTSNNLLVGDVNFSGNIAFFNHGAQNATLDTGGNFSTTGNMSAGINVIAGAANGNFLANNNQGLYIKNTSGNYVQQVVLDGGNNEIIGTTLAAGQLQFWNNGAESGFFETNHRFDLNSDLVVNRHVIYLAGSGDTNHVIYNAGGDGEVFSFHNFLDLVQDGNTARLYIAGNGFVGINNTSPGQSIDIAGNANVSGAYLVNGAQLSCGNLSNAALSCSVDTTNASNISRGTLPSTVLSGAYNGITGVGGNLTINGNSASFTHGYVGYNGSTAVGLVDTAAGGSGSYFQAKDDGSVVAAEANGSFCAYTGGTSWGCSSDINMKNPKALQPQDLAPSAQAGGTMMQQINRLAPIGYTLKNDRAQAFHAGFSAQHMQGVFPALVSAAPDGTLILEYTGLIAPLVQAMQELDARVSALEAKVH